LIPRVCGGCDDQSGHELLGRHATQRVMRSVFVVSGQPIVGDGLDLLDGVEQVGIEYLGAERPVEALDVGVLIGSSTFSNVTLPCFVASSKRTFV